MPQTDMPSVTVKTEQPSTFWDRLDARVAPFNLLAHPFYQAWSKGELTREDLREYAAEYYHHVSAFPTYLSGLHARLPDGGMRREVLRNLMDEEGVGAREGRAHSELWMEFAEGMGADAAAVAGRDLLPETRALIASFRATVAQQEPVVALAAFYAYESRVPEIARTKAEGLREHYSADAATSRYFTLHETADVYHARVWRGLMETELAARPESAEVALAAAETAAQALWTALDGIERERTQRNCVAA